MSEKKRAKWRKGKERLQLANNHSYCLDVSIFFICAPSRGLNTETQCIIECSGLIAGIHRLIACLAGVWKEGKGEGDSKRARSTKGTWERAEVNSFHPPPLLADSHPNSLPHPFWMPAMQANWLKMIFIGRRLFCFLNMPLNFLFQDRCSQFWSMFNSSVWKS